MNRLPISLFHRSFLAALALAAGLSAQNAKLSIVSGMKSGDLLHIGVSTPDPQMNRASILYSIGASVPWTLHGVPVVVSPVGLGVLAVLNPQACAPPSASNVGFAFGALIPAGVPAGIELHVQALVWSSAQPSHSTISDGAVVTTQPAGPALARWGTSAMTSALRLQRLDVDALSVSVPIDVPWPKGPAGNQLTLASLATQPAVSIDDFSAAVPVNLNDPNAAGGVRTAIYVLRDIRAPSAAETTGYWLPMIDPATSVTSTVIVGAPRFNPDPAFKDDLWVLELGNSSPTYTGYRLARYRLGPTSAEFLGAANLVDPLHSVTHLPTTYWLVHAGLAVFLQQNGDKGLELVRYTTAGGVASRFPVDTDGFMTFHASFEGIMQVPSHPWALMQYGLAEGGACQARVIDLDTEALSKKDLSVGIQVGRMSTDGTLALFADVQGKSEWLVPVKLAQPVTGQPLEVLPKVDKFFCGSDSVATEGSTLVTTPGGCGGWTTVHRTSLDTAGQLEIVDTCTTTGYGPLFSFYDAPGPQPIAFRVPGRNAVIDDSQGVLQMLDATTMTYGTIAAMMTAAYIF